MFSLFLTSMWRWHCQCATLHHVHIDYYTSSNKSRNITPQVAKHYRISTDTASCLWLQLQGTDGETHRHSSLSDLVYWSIKVSTAYNPLRLYQLSFTRSEFSMAFPYVSTTVDERLEDSLLSSFAENYNNGFGRNRITYTDTCTGQDLKKYHNMDAINVSYSCILRFCFHFIFAPCTD